MKRVIFVGVMWMLVIVQGIYGQTNHNAILICPEKIGESREIWGVWDATRWEDYPVFEEMWNDMYLMWELLYVNSRYKLYAEADMLSGI